MPRSDEEPHAENCKKLCIATVLFVKHKAAIANILNSAGEKLAHELTVSKRGSVKGSHKNDLIRDRTITIKHPEVSIKCKSLFLRMQCHHPSSPP